MEPRYLAFPPHVLDLREHTLWTGDRPRYLTPKTFETLALLLRHAGETVRKEQLLKAVWPGSVVTENALTRVIKELRQALGDDARAPSFIETVPRVGYRFVAGVEARTDHAPADDLVRHPAKTDAPPPKGWKRYAPWIGIAALITGVTLSVLNLRDRASPEPPDGPARAGEPPGTHTTAPATPTGLLAPKVKPDAWLEYTQGRELVNERGETERRRAVAHFRRAIELDPDYAAAYSGLADALLALGTFLPPRAIVPDAIEATRQALELDPDNIEARISLASLARDYQWDFDAAEAGFREVLEREPEYVPVYVEFAELQVYRERYAEALALLEKAIDIDPLSPLPRGVAGWTLLMQGDTAAARAMLDSALALAPDFVLTHLNYGLLSLREEDWAGAVGHLARSMELAGPSPDLAGLQGYAAAKGGDEQTAKDLLARLDALRSERYVTPMGPALIYLGLGEKKAAIRQLEAAYGDRNWHLVMLRGHFLFDGMRGEKAFEELVERFE